MYYVAFLPTERGGRAYSLATGRVKLEGSPISAIGNALQVFDSIVRGSKRTGIAVLYRYLPERTSRRVVRKANGRKRRKRGQYVTIAQCEPLHIAWCIGR